MNEHTGHPAAEVYAVQTLDPTLHQMQTDLAAMSAEEFLSRWGSPAR